MLYEHLKNLRMDVLKLGKHFGERYDVLIMEATRDS